MAPSSGSTFEVIEAASEEISGRIAEAGQEDMNRAIDAAKRAFDEGPWPRLTHEERADYLRRLGEGLDRRTSDLALLWLVEVGVVNFMAEMVLGSVGSIFAYYASLATEFPFVERHQPMAGEIGLLVREPVGVVGAIVPWNRCLADQPARRLHGPIVTGTHPHAVSPGSPHESCCRFIACCRSRCRRGIRCRRRLVVRSRRRCRAA
jgi:acyl-CoA reductase-like NAD-dependent aldehyde dehydrogenase